MSSSAIITDEIHKLANFYSLPFSAIDERIEQLNPFLGSYCEFALGEYGFEVITEGKGKIAAERFARLARDGGLCAEYADLFLACEERFSGRHLGFKQSFGVAGKPPSLYVRFKSPKQEVLEFLKERNLSDRIIAELEAQLKPNEIFYGIGFFGEDERKGMKTYVLQSLSSPWIGTGSPVRGFLSHRWIEEELSLERKEYFPELPFQQLDRLGSAWRRILNFVQACLEVKQASHFSVRYLDGHAPEFKIYLERIGSIPTDFAAV